MKFSHIKNKKNDVDDDYFSTFAIVFMSPLKVLQHGYWKIFIRIELKVRVGPSRKRLHMRFAWLKSMSKLCDATEKLINDKLSGESSL